MMFHLCKYLNVIVLQLPLVIEKSFPCPMYNIIKSFADYVLKPSSLLKVLETFLFDISQYLRRRAWSYISQPCWLVLYLSHNNILYTILASALSFVYLKPFLREISNGFLSPKLLHISTLTSR